MRFQPRHRMGQYGKEEPVNPALTVLSVLFGGLTGCVLGFCGFLLATAFPAMMRIALPTMTHGWFIGLWTASVALPAYLFLGVYRKGKGYGARAYALCGITVLLLLFAGELTGTTLIYPWHTRFYLTPGPYEQPVKR